MSGRTIPSTKRLNHFLDTAVFHLETVMQEEKFALARVPREAPRPRRSGSRELSPFTAEIRR